MLEHAPEVPSSSETTPSVKDYPVLRRYYESLESRLGYQFFLGGTRHYGYWDKDTYWPFPLSKALRRMESKLLSRLDLAPGARVLDAGCGDGHVAVTVARSGLIVTAIDVLPLHVDAASKTIERSGLPKDQVTVQHMDYHDLAPIPSASHDGVYTMETFVHAADPARVLSEFHRVLKPGGRCVLFEYDNDFDPHSSSPWIREMTEINTLASMPTGQAARRGLYESLLAEAGFVDITREDYTENVRPMLRLFYLVAIIPYLLFKALRIERHFPNTMAAAAGFRLTEYRQHYVSVSARKPDGPAESANLD